MSETEKQFTPLQYCDHCGNRAPMEIVTRHTRIKSEGDIPRNNLSQARRTVYELLSCPACEGVSLRSYSFHEPSTDSSEIEFKTLYPVNQDQQFDFPETIGRTRIAQKFRDFDPSRHRLMLRRLSIIHECNRSKRV